MNFRRIVSLVWTLALALFFAACGSEGSSADGSEGELSTDSYELQYSLEPSPAQVGENMLMLSVKDTDGEPVAALPIRVEAWMEAHGHGSEATPEIMEMSDGHYHVENLVLQMPGVWSITIELGPEEEAEAVSIELNVE
ncbi:MAG: FixH family protein [Polyangiaceae bacterium]|nr:FixH family protein [Polyangiaceae bacterium]